MGYRRCIGVHFTFLATGLQLQIIHIDKCMSTYLDLLYLFNKKKNYGEIPRNIDEKFSLIKQYLEGMLLVSNIFLTVTSFTTLIMDYFYICLSV